MKQYCGVKIKQRTDGRWYSRIKITNNKYHYIYGKTQSECYDKLKTFLDQPKLLKSLKRNIEKKEKAKSAPKRYTIEEWREYWLRTYKIPNCKSSTIRRLGYVYDNHISSISKCYIDALTTMQLQELLANIPTASMRWKTYVVLNDMLGKAADLEFITKNPLAIVKVPKYKSTERQAIEPEEQQRFIAEAKQSEYWSIYALMLFEGLRTGEAKALRHCDIKQDYIIVRASLNDIGEVTDTKTGNIRRIPIFAPFRSIADNLRSQSTSLILKKPNKHSANDEYRKIMQRLGLEYNMYALRHTFATNCARAGISPKQVQLWLGHSDVEMTLKYYTNISSSFEAENVKTFDTLFDTDLS